VPVRPIAAAVAFRVALLLTTGAAHAQLDLISAKRGEPTHRHRHRRFAARLVVVDHFSEVIDAHPGRKK
jgi:hypothetical protein